MIVLRLLFFPLRVFLWIWFVFRNRFRIGDTLVHRVPDRFTLNRPAGWLAYFMARQEAFYIEYLAGLKIVAESPEIKTFAIIVPEMLATLTEIEEIARRIDAIRAAGKHVVAFAEGGNLKTILLLSTADRRYAGRNADFHVTFPSAEPFFIRDALARLGIRVDSHAAGKYKSAAEMFTRSSFSPPARKAFEELLGSMRAELENRLIATPGLTEAQARQLVNTLRNKTVLEAAELVRLGFATAELEAHRLGPEALGFPEEPPVPAHPFLRDQTGAAEDGQGSPTAREQTRTRPKKKPEPPRLATERALFARYRRRRFRLWRLRRPRVLAFVNMEGPIVSGRPGNPPHGTNIDAEAFRDLLKQIQAGPEEAVFLYINSPGGSAAASELLYQSIAELGRQKPVFALLGPVAASGGYYIAAAAHRIYAAATTITGSIGVITIRPDLKGLYKKLGVKKERIGFDKTRDLLSEAGSLSPASLALLKRHIQSSYALFLERVAAGRGLGRGKVEQFAEGRVWTGREFLKHGLLDTVGDLFDALADYKKTMGYARDHDLLMNFYPETKADLRSVLEERLPGVPGLARSPATIAPAAGALEALFDTYLRGELALLWRTPALCYLPVRLLLRALV